MALFALLGCLTVQAVDVAPSADGKPNTVKESPQEMLGLESKERGLKAVEKKSVTFQKGLFRMGMKFQGYLHSLSKTEDKQMAAEIKDEISKLEKKLPRYITNKLPQEFAEQTR